MAYLGLSPANVPFANTINSSLILDGTITSSDLADGSVTSSKIADSNITTAKLADGNITTAKLADGNITTAKLADGNVTTAKLADGNVTTAKLADNAITTAKIAANAVVTVDIADGNVTLAKLADDSVSTAKILNANVTSLKMSNTGVTAGTYGDTSNVVTLSIDAAGRITSAANVNVSNYTGNLRVTSNINVAGTIVLDSSRNLSNIASANVGSIVAGPGAAASGMELTVVGAYATGAPQAVAASAIDASTGNWFTKTATGALGWTITNVPSSSYTYGFILELTNGGLGTQTWFTGTRWPSGVAPTLQSAGTDILVFLTRDGGTNWRASLVQGASA